MEDVNRALTSFESSLALVRKSCVMLEGVVDVIEKTVLIREEDFKDVGCLEISDFYDRMERNRLSKLEALVHKYKSIQPIMQQVRVCGRAVHV